MTNHLIPIDLVDLHNSDVQPEVKLAFQTTAFGPDNRPRYLPEGTLVKIVSHRELFAVITIVDDPQEIHYRVMYITMVSFPSID